MEILKMIVNLKEIRIDGGTQVRVAIDQQTVDDYAEAFDAGVKFPPVTVYHDGASYWLADGFHRYHGARKAGMVGIQCEVQKGTVAEARWAAIGANVTHGLRRRNEDKQKAVRMALELHAEYSDAVIAEHAGVSQNTVTTARRQVPQIGGPAHRIGKDGKSYPVPPLPVPLKHVETKSAPVSAPIPPPPARAPAPATPTDTPAEKMKDSAGREIPENLQAMWNRREEIEDMKACISEVRVVLRKARESGDPLYAGVPQDVVTWLDNTYAELDNAKPYIICPWCGGMSKTCKMCGGPKRGFVSEFQYKTFAPAELKAIVQNGGAK